MKRIVGCLAALLAIFTASFAGAASHAVASRAPDTNVLPGISAPQDGDGNCATTAPGIIVHDDNSAEVGYAFSPNSTHVSVAELFTPTAYPATLSSVCFSFLFSEANRSARVDALQSIPVDVVAYAADGAGGTPGTELGRKRVPADLGSLDSNFPITPVFQSLDISDFNLNIASGGVFISLEWYPSSIADAQSVNTYIFADESPATPAAGSLRRIDEGGWELLSSVTAEHRALMLRAVAYAAGSSPPAIAAAFSPTTITAGSPAALTLTLSNRQTSAATLTSALIETFPAGMSALAQAQASTTCSGDGVTLVSGSVTLAAGAQIPAAGSCTITVDKVTTSAGGYYTTTIPSGALQTSLGSNVGAAYATLTAYGQSTFPPDENFDENPAPLLPLGWTTSGDHDWTVVELDADTQPNAASTRDIGAPSDFTLDSPPFTAIQNQSVTFVHTFQLTQSQVGAVLELSIDGGAFTDIIEAGGFFLAGGYNGRISSSSSAITGRDAWTDAPRDFQRVTTTVSLPTAAVGHSVVLRFRKVEDGNTFAGGGSWTVDSIHLGTDGAGTAPTVTVSPGLLSLTTPENAALTSTLHIANSATGAPLTFSIVSRHAASANRPVAAGLASDRARIGHAIGRRGETMVVLSTQRNGVPTLAAAPGANAVKQAPPPWAPRAADGSLSFILDDGTVDGGLGLNDGVSRTHGAVWINQFRADGPLTIDSISIYWADTPPGHLPSGLTVGLHPNLVVYYDVNSTGNPINAVRIGMDTVVTIDALDAAQTYPTTFSIPGAGDVYIGFVDEWDRVAGGVDRFLFPAAQDETAPQGKSWVSGNAGGNVPTDIDHLANNSTNRRPDDFLIAGNWMIRASGTPGGTGAPCTGVIEQWPVATPNGGTLMHGGSADITLTVDPVADHLAPGTYSTQLCIATNDAAHPLIAVPLTLTVTPAAPCATDDTIFCDGLEGVDSAAPTATGVIAHAQVQRAGNDAASIGDTPERQRGLR